MSERHGVRLARFQISELPELLLVGKGMRYNMDPSRCPEAPPALWDRCFADGTFDVLRSRPEHVHDPSLVGYMDGYDEESGGFDYVCGMMLKPGAPVPDGFVARVLAPTKVAIGWIQGPQSDEPALYRNAHVLTEAALREMLPDFRYDVWSAEVYVEPRVSVPDAAGDVVLDYYLPFHV